MCNRLNYYSGPVFRKSEDWKESVNSRIRRVVNTTMRYKIQEEAKLIRSLPPLPQGPFGVIVLDPAWEYDKDAWRFSVSALLPGLPGCRLRVLEPLPDVGAGVGRPRVAALRLRVLTLCSNATLVFRRRMLLLVTTLSLYGSVYEHGFDARGGGNRPLARRTV
jgi:hypothetical protein